MNNRDIFSYLSLLISLAFGILLISFGAILHNMHIAINDIRNQLVYQQAEIDNKEDAEQHNADIKQQYAVVAAIINGINKEW